MTVGYNNLFQSLLLLLPANPVGVARSCDASGLKVLKLLHMVF
jgi:hypothetical protein